MRREEVTFATIRQAQGDRNVTETKKPFALSLSQHCFFLFWCHARPLCIISVNRLNRYAASWGPGEASGWYWTENMGMSRQRSPSTASSFKLAWLTCTGPYGVGQASPLAGASSLPARTAKLWFCAVISTRFVSKFRTG